MKNSEKKVNMEAKKYYRIASKNLLINTTLEETEGQICPNEFNSKDNFLDINKPKNMNEVIRTIKKPFIPKYMVFKEDRSGQLKELFTEKTLGDAVFCYDFEYGTNLKIIEPITAHEALVCIKDYSNEEKLEIAKRFRDFYKQGKQYQDELRQQIINNGYQKLLK